jgi:hypothetical protein
MADAHRGRRRARALSHLMGSILYFELALRSGVVTIAVDVVYRPRPARRRLFRSGALVCPSVFAVGIASLVICFPYAIYLIVRVAKQDLTDIRSFRLGSMLAAIAGFFMLGFSLLPSYFL